MKTKIGSLNDIALSMHELNEAAEVEIFSGVGEGVRLEKDFKGIWNVQQEKLATITSNRYKIIQHRDVMAAVVETLGGLNINVAGRLDNYSNVIKADLYFTNQGVPVKDDKDGIMIGFRMMNSYNKVSSFRLEMYGFRIVCQNGMTFGNRLGVREITFHTGKDKTSEVICATVRSFIAEVIQSSSKMQQYVSEMMTDSIEWQIAEELLEKLLPIKKHRLAIMDKLLFANPKEAGKVTRWELYNALTNYATHNESLKRGAEAWLEQRSQIVLTNNTSKLVEKFCEVRQ